MIDRHVYSKDLKKTALSFLMKIGFTSQNKKILAKVLNCHVSTVYNWCEEVKLQGNIMKANVRPSKILIGVKKIHFEWLLGEIDKTPSVYLFEMQKLLFQQFGYSYSRSVIYRALKQSNYSHKVLEKHSIQQCKIARNNFRHLMRSTRLCGQFTAKQLLFLDETYCDNEQIQRKYGWARRGQPAFQRGNFINGQSCSAISSLSIEGI